MKKNKESKILFGFYVLDIFLLLVLALTFIPSLFGKKTYVESSVLNPKYVSEVSKIEVSIPESGNRKNILMENDGGIWLGKCSVDDYSSVFPCDENTVKNLISVSSTVSKMFIKANSENHWKDLCVDDENAARIMFFGKDGNVLSELYFGVQDSMTNRIAVRSVASKVVYDMNDSIDTYLTASESFWVDPFLFPQCITGYSRNKSEDSLRHGQISYAPDSKELKLLGNYSKKFENESSVLFVFYENADGTVFVLPSFSVGQSVSQEKFDAISKIRYSYTISKWTYEQLIKN